MPKGMVVNYNRQERFALAQAKERKMNVLYDLRNFNEAKTTDVLDIVALSVQAKLIRTECEAKNVPVPEWLEDTIRSLNRVISERTRDARELRLKEINAEETRLLSAPERRAKLAEEKAKLQAELAGV